MTLPLVVGLSGPVLTAEEQAFLTDAKPLGVILFARNVADPAQLRRLIDDCRAALDSSAWILIDQEGGRVARLRPPHWSERPAAGVLGALGGDLADEAAYLTARLIADDLHQLGVTVDCWPVLDVPAPDGHDIIGDRAFGARPDHIARLGRAACQGLLDGGVLPVIKHIPGHGRATADSHETLPVVNADAAGLETDFAPFRALSDMPLAMTAHVVYQCIDDQNPATWSHKLIAEVIRRDIGFDGILLTDDITMRALSGPMAARAEKALDAGCDIVLHCNGDLAEMRAVAEVCPRLADAMRERIAAADQRLNPPKPFDRAAAEERLQKYLADG